jgi:hypothetical protein
MTPRGVAAVGVRTVVAFALLVLLAACARAPSEAARQQAIGNHVVAAEAYPPAFVRTEAFTWRNLQRVPESTPPQFAVEADFDVTYTADGKAIVAALREQARADREKQRRRTNTVLEHVTSVLGDALASAEFEQRFEDVRIGDRDHYTGRFVLARNEDGTWRVVDADYR